MHQECAQNQQKFLPHFKLLNSALFFIFEYLCASTTTDDIVPTGSPCTKLEAKIPDAISENSSLCFLFQLMRMGKFYYFFQF